jgi:hypothetical protein
LENRNTAIIATLLTTLLCGCPGLFSLCMGAAASMAAVSPDSEINIQGMDGPAAALALGLGFLCLGLVLVAIPAAVGYFTLRNKPAARYSEADLNEPLPPAN